jgi:hypothetical protein
MGANEVHGNKTCRSGYCGGGMKSRVVIGVADSSSKLTCLEAVKSVAVEVPSKRSNRTEVNEDGVWNIERRAAEYAALTAP